MRWCRWRGGRPDWSHAALHAIEVDLTDAGATEQAAGSIAGQFAVGTVVHNAGADPARISSPT